MAARSLQNYLNDHIGGAEFGSRLAVQLRDRNPATPFGETMEIIAAEIEEDRLSLMAIASSLEVKTNPVKRVGGWIAERFSLLKFSGLSSGDPAYGDFMAIETLRLGVTGKLCLWKALRLIADQYDELNAQHIDQLIERAEGQLASLEASRSDAAYRLFRKQ